LLLRIRSLLRKPAVDGAVLGKKHAFQQARLLAIDDSPTYLEFLVGELEEEGYRVERATGGAEALKKFSLADFDCVLVDLVMPDLDGIQVCQRINDQRALLLKPLVVLMLTAHESKDDLTRALEAGADDFVGKSNDMAVL